MRTRLPNTEQFQELKKQFVREALEGGNTSFIARKHGLNPKTLGQWVREFRDEVEEEMETKKSKPQMNPQQEDQDVKKQLDQALKLIGKLQVENEILKDLLKKTK